MAAARLFFASILAISICAPAAVAQQTGEGIVTSINRLNGSIAIQRTQSGTVGANTAGATEEFKVKDGSLLEPVHAGDAVTFSVVESGGTKTITQLQRQKK